MQTKNNEKDIKNRMIQKAASLWGIAPKDIDSSFDPLVSLLISACASEIGKIEGEIYNSQTRITERLIQLMTPEAIHGANPAHAIAYAEPVDKSITLKPKNQLYHKKKTASARNRAKQKNIFLSPSREMRLIDAEITRVLCGDKLFSQDGKNGKQYIGTMENYAEPSKLYLGIKSNKDNIPLKDVSVYFEHQDTSLSDLFYHHLKNAKCSLNSEKITITKGFFEDKEQDHLNVEAFFNSVTNKTQSIENRINQFYQKNFISIKSLSYLSKKGALPEGVFSDADIKDNPELKDLNWIEIEFPRIIDTGILEQVFVSLNAFPVLNRRLTSFSYQLKDFIHIIPIQTNDLFLDIKTVENTDGKKYILRQNSTTQQRKGTFILREDQAGKLDSRNAKQFLSHMMELMKEESAAFSFLGSDFLQTNINKLNQTILLLEKRAEDLTEKSNETVYISVKPYSPKEILMIEYWTTDGDMANKIKGGTSLYNYEGTDIKQKSARLLTNTFNGKDTLSMDERLNSYRSSLLSRDRIVTKQDVSALCYSIYNDRIKDVEVQRSYTSDISTNKGVVPCMKITLHANRRNKLEEQEWQSLNNNLLSILEDKSVNVFPYVVEVKN
ncbi:type VI secretion system baseplate subunit TssF [uncultured Marixanthomonas sp.]|uniref:type VI secretion system baseplate subunit TssF n=1 Tax=uncultured Marixanthomonas sp. TaxID=757245 RepID=UPI0030D9ED78|tara:strand:- start:17514 stop:19346 length:1833 start_codon:yes stop_codon:yes gene_type:complete